MHSLCRFTDPEVLLYVNLDALRALRSIIGDEEIGVYGSIDGMFINAARPQHASVSEEHERLLNHGLDIGFGWHGRVGCRGLSKVTITDIKTTLPLVWLYRPANQREYTCVLDLLGILFRLWPDCPLTYLVGDSEYDQSGDLAFDMESRYGVHPVFYTWHLGRAIAGTRTRTRAPRDAQSTGR